MHKKFTKLGIRLQSHFVATLRVQMSVFVKILHYSVCAVV